VATEKKNIYIWKSGRSHSPPNQLPYDIYNDRPQHQSQSHLPCMGAAAFSTSICFVFFLRLQIGEKKKKWKNNRNGPSEPTHTHTPCWNFVCIIKLASDRWASFSHTAKTTSCSCSCLLTFF
jgi:hypothetical protein